MKAKPYLRGDLEVVGGSIPPAREFIVTTWQNIGAPRRLLATLDAAYEEFDETRAEDAAVIAKLRSELAFKNNDLATHREKAVEQILEISEEAAAWKDQYATLKPLYDQRGRVLDQTSEQWKAMKASREKWRKRARRANAAAIPLMEEINELQQQNAQDISDLKRSNEALEAQLCAESKDHRNTIEFAAKSLHSWMSKKWGDTRGDIVGQWLAWGGVEETQQLKREAGL